MTRENTEFDRGSRYFFLKCKFACVKQYTVHSEAMPLGKGVRGYANQRKL